MASTVTEYSNSHPLSNTAVIIYSPDSLNIKSALDDGIVVPFTAVVPDVLIASID